MELRRFRQEGEISRTAPEATNKARQDFRGRLGRPQQAGSNGRSLNLPRARRGTRGSRNPPKGSSALLPVCEGGARAQQDPSKTPAGSGSSVGVGKGILHATPSQGGSNNPRYDNNPKAAAHEAEWFISSLFPFMAETAEDSREGHLAQSCCIDFRGRARDGQSKEVCLIGRAAPGRTEAPGHPRAARGMLERITGEGEEPLPKAADPTVLTVSPRCPGWPGSPSFPGGP